MAKIYSKKVRTAIPMKPKKETISFLLNYSKALRFMQVGKQSFEWIAN